MQSVKSHAEETVLARFGVSPEESHKLERGLFVNMTSKSQKKPAFVPQINSNLVAEDSIDLEEDSTDWVLDKVFMSHIEEFQEKHKKHIGLREK